MCFACAMMVFVLQGGEDGRGTDGGGGRTKTRIARPKHIIKSCVKMHMNSNIHNEFPAPFWKKILKIFLSFFRGGGHQGAILFSISRRFRPFWVDYDFFQFFAKSFFLLITEKKIKNFLKVVQNHLVWILKISIFFQS